MVSRRSIVIGVLTTCWLFTDHASAQLSAPVKRPNILMIVADDMNWDSPGCFGGAAEEITPHIDRLAAEGMLFRHAYMNVSICTPSRSVMLTGLYPQNNGAEGFQRIKPDTPTLPALLNEAGYVCGTVGKPLSQEELFRWSVAYRWPGAGDEHLWGRDPAMYRKFAARFFAMAKASNQPFFLMASSHDPHSPFAGGHATKEHEQRAPASRAFAPEDVRLPAILPDLPGVRDVFADYCTSVRRLDDMAGAVLDELEKAAFVEDTIVIFLSDHGMPFPGAKFNCYPDSVRSPWVVRWPGKVKPGAVDNRHMISAIDLMPTILEAVGLEPGRTDGRSFLPLLRGDSQDGRDRVFAQFFHIHGRDALPMRSIITHDAVYVFNPWSNGRRRFARFRGKVFEAMKSAAEKDPAMAARVRHLASRTVEEFYDRTEDPACLKNVVDQSSRSAQVNTLRSSLRAWMLEMKDPALAAFDRRDQPQALEKFVVEYAAAAAKAKQTLRAYEAKKGYRF